MILYICKDHLRKMNSIRPDEEYSYFICGKYHPTPYLLSFKSVDDAVESIKSNPEHLDENVHFKHFITRFPRASALKIIRNNTKKNPHLLKEAYHRFLGLAETFELSNNFKPIYNDFYPVEIGHLQ